MWLVTRSPTLVAKGGPVPDLLGSFPALNAAFCQISGLGGARGGRGVLAWLLPCEWSGGRADCVGPHGAGSFDQS